MGHIHEVIIREATIDDREAIAEVMLEAYGQYANSMPETAWAEYSASIRDSVDGDAPVARIIAEIEGRIVGSIQLFLSSEAAYGNKEMGLESPIIRLLAVSPQARGRGIATLLIQESARRSLELGATTLNLHTSDMMASAIQLYERLGFERHYASDIYNGRILVKGFQVELSKLQLQQDAVS